MGAFLIYLELEIKKAGRVLPRFFAGAIVLVAILGTIAFSASKVLYSDTVMNRASIGVVLPEDDSLAELAVRMLSSLESVKSVCDFHYLEETLGREKLEEGTLNALMIVPDGFVSDIITGVNTPVTIVLPDHPGMEAMVFKELADAGARTLSVAQASIYAVDELCSAYQMEHEISQVEEELNRIYFAYALPRADYFRDYKVSATAEVTVMQYYGISAAVLFLFFCGIPLATLCEPEKPVLVQKLKSIGINQGLQILSKVISVALLLGLVSGIGVAALVFFGFIRFQLVHIMITLLICLVIASMIVTVFTITGSPIVGVMGLFWLTIGMLFLSGGFVPSVFLPEAIRQISSLIPTTPMVEVLKVFAGVKISVVSIVQLLAWGIGCYLVAVVSRRRI